MLFQTVEAIQGAYMPHYTIREAIGPPLSLLTVSFRVLRKQSVEEPLKSQIATIMKERGLAFRIDPQGNDHFAQCRAWASKGEVNPYWTRKRCDALNTLSRSIASFSTNSVFDSDSRFEWAHLFVNMLGLQEAVMVSDSTQPIRGLIGSAYYDLITRNSKGPYKTTIVEPRARIGSE
jgi:hypothetical protein